jgi:uncharacterized protein
MSTEQNIEVAKHYFAALGKRDAKAMSTFMTDDAKWWILPGNKFSGFHEKAKFLSSLDMLFEKTPGDFEIKFLEVTAMENRIAILAKGNIPLKDGGNYDSDYNFLLTFRDGKIVEGREFLDAVLVNKVFGAPEE